MIITGKTTRLAATESRWDTITFAEPPTIQKSRRTNAQWLPESATAFLTRSRDSEGTWSDWYLQRLTMEGHNIRKGGEVGAPHSVRLWSAPGVESPFELEVYRWAKSIRDSLNAQDGQTWGEMDGES